MAGAQSTGGAIATIPTLTPTQRADLQQRWRNATDMRLGNRFLCVLLAGPNRWSAEQVEEQLGIPAEIANHYFGAYNAQGIEGLGKAAQGEDAFYGGGAGTSGQRR